MTEIASQRRTGIIPVVGGALVMGSVIADVIGDISASNHPPT